jgi:hypothetical protein
MTDRHWSDDDLLDRLYGIGPGDGHLEQCPECQSRWNRLSTRRSELLRPPEVSSSDLAAQRRNIYRRLDRPARSAAVRFAPILAVFAMLLVAFFLWRPGSAPQAPPPAPQISDAQLFSEVSSMAQSSEPQAAEPIHALFESN